MINPIHIGNDIVELNSARRQSNKLRQRSLEKMFNPSEIAYLKDHSDSMLAYWHLWSAKESAYKAWQRINNCKPIFNPIEFNCSVISGNLTSIENGEFRSKVSSLMTSEFIYSQCQSNRFDHKLFSSKESYKEWMSQLSDKGWALRKCPHNIPNFYNSASSKTIPVSISHDNSFFAIAWERENW